MDNSPLGRLSPELRNQIYELVFQPSNRSYLQVRPTRLDAANFAQTIAIAQTCRQVRAEARLLFFATNDFRFDCSSAPKSLVAPTRWLQNVGPDALEVMRSMLIGSVVSANRAIKFESESQGGRPCVRYQYEGYKMQETGYNLLGLRRYKVFDPIVKVCAPGFLAADLLSTELLLQMGWQGTDLSAVRC